MIEDVLASLKPPEITAVNILKLAMDAHNSADGTGLFQGVSRYEVLQGRSKLAAVRSQTIMEFWSHLHTAMCWSAPPARFDAELAKLFSVDHGKETLSIIANQGAAIIAISRMLHSSEKKKRMAEKKHGLDWELSEESKPKPKPKATTTPTPKVEIDSGSLFNDLEDNS